MQKRHKEQMLDNLKAQIREELMDKLIELGHLQSYDKIERVRPGHGYCCTCQDCGFAHEDCVCGHNELLDAVNEIFA